MIFGCTSLWPQSDFSVVTERSLCGNREIDFCIISTNLSQIVDIRTLAMPSRPHKFLLVSFKLENMIIKAPHVRRPPPLPIFEQLKNGKQLKEDLEEDCQPEGSPDKEDPKGAQDSPAGNMHFSVDILRRWP